MPPSADVTAQVTQAVPLFGVSNIQASLRFYVDGLGFQIKNSWAPEGEVRWCRLELGAAALMIQARVEPIPSRDGMSICFQCADSIALYQQFRARGIDARRPFVGNGLWVTIVKDPDGYQLEFSSPTDVAEETEYSEPTESAAP